MPAPPVLPLLRPQRLRLIAAVAAQAAASAASLAALVAVARTAAGWLAGDRPSATDAGLIATAFLAAVAGALLAGLAAWLAHVADAGLRLGLQRRLVERFAGLPLRRLTGRGGGTVKKTVHDDVHGLHQLVAHTLTDITAVVATPVLGLAYLAFLDPRVAAAALIPLLAGALLYARAMAGASARFAEYGAAQAAINAAAADHVRGVAEVKTFGLTGRATGAFHRATTAFHDFFRAWSSATTGVTTASWLVVAPGVTLTLFAALGTWAAVAGWASAEAVVALALVGPAVSAPVAVLGPRLQALRTGLSAARGITALLDEPVLRWGDGSTVPQGAEVRYEDVSFDFDGTPVLTGVDVTLPAGGFTALVGPSGAGKSTFAGLLARFDDPRSGRIRVGGADLRDLTQETLYETVSFVFQDVVLLRGSVLDNLTGGRAYPREAVEAAARAARIHDRITRLPDGYDTVVGEGVELSGGEAQRLSIARALLRDTPVVVLDEATAAADPGTEAALQEALGELARGRTVLLIAHRLDTVTGADLILVLDGGAVAERGTHHELLALGGRYAASWAAQHEMEGTR
ncbi:ABC transporter ATP-binding protein [Streptomyces sp. RFCAC02]|uniref:ABC transporter ATP-binding protein n=1 Tax=Streptomyces sp. RFCAC02 TaxID=2499143 RepID=UPI00143CCE57|nr:ABC transporter ATP-binding protein [Streptomyces sp. RFCAC02]